MNIIIVGGGQVGAYLGKFLDKHGHKIRIVENRERAKVKIKDLFTAEQLIFADGCDPQALIKAEINKADVLVAVTGHDEINLVASTLAKMEFGVPKVIARVNNPKNAWLFTPDMGVDDTINQADILSNMIIGDMKTKNMFSLFRLNHGNNAVLTFVLPSTSAAIGKAVNAVTLPEKTVLVSLIRDGKALMPDENLSFKENDEVVIFSDEDHTDELERIF